MLQHKRCGEQWIQILMTIMPSYSAGHEHPALMHLLGYNVFDDMFWNHNGFNYTKKLTITAIFQYPLSPLPYSLNSLAPHCRGHRITLCSSRRRLIRRCARSANIDREVVRVAVAVERLVAQTMFLWVIFCCSTGMPRMRMM